MRVNSSIAKQSGSVVVSYLAILIPMIIASAATIVIGYQVQLSNRAMQAADAASFACEFKGEYDEELSQGYLDFYQPNISKVDARLGASSGCKVEMGYSLSTLFSALTLSDASYVASATASEKAYVSEVSDSDPIELVLVLDISSSMFGDIDELKAILNRGLTSLQNQQSQALSRDHIKVSIIPFSDGVSVHNAPWLSTSGTFCVEGTSEVDGSFSASTTVENLDVTHAQVPVKTSTPSDWRADCSSTSATLPLTSNMNDAIDAVNKLDTSGGTASYQGFIWGLRQLTPNWQAAWRIGPNRDEDNVERKLVLMTDGADAGTALDDLINAGLCDRATEFGIDLNFVGFGVQGSRLEQFNRCAGSANGVFSANNTQQLNEYFSQLLSIEYDTKLNFGNN